MKDLLFIVQDLDSGESESIEASSHYDAAAEFLDEYCDTSMYYEVKVTCSSTKVVKKFTSEMPDPENVITEIT